MPRYRFIGPPPRSFKIVATAIGVNFTAREVAVAFRDLWAAQARIEPFTYPIRFRGSHIWYFTPAVGRYIEWSFIGHFVGIAILALIAYQHRDSMERIGGPSEEV